MQARDVGKNIDSKGTALIIGICYNGRAATKWMGISKLQLSVQNTVLVTSGIDAQESVDRAQRE